MSFLAGGNDQKKFVIDSATGVLTLNATLDHEMRAEYTLQIKAANPKPGPATTPAEKCNNQCRDPSVLTLNVLVGDINEEAPVFSNSVLNACELYNAL